MNGQPAKFGSAQVAYNRTRRTKGPAMEPVRPAKSPALRGRASRNTVPIKQGGLVLIGTSLPIGSDAKRSYPGQRFGSGQRTIGLEPKAETAPGPGRSLHLAGRLPKFSL